MGSIAIGPKHKLHKHPEVAHIATPVAPSAPVHIHTVTKEIVEVPTYVIKEVFVDKPRDVFVDKIVEKEVIKEIIKEVIVEVEKPIEVVKQVFVPQEILVEKIIEKIVPIIPKWLIGMLASETLLIIILLISKL